MTGVQTCALPIYKPLLLYIKNKDVYYEEIEQMIEKLKIIVPKLNKIFEDDCFSELLRVLEIYNVNVVKHYEEYKKTNEIWNLLKGKINNEVT